MTGNQISIGSLQLDQYTLIARIAPWMIVFLPLFVAIGVIEPSALDLGTGVLSILSAIAVATLLSHLCRGAGARTEIKLWRDWGGAPSTAFLRHRDATIEAPTKKRYHRILEEIVLGWKAPSVNDEIHDPAEADASYRAAVSWLRGATRDHKQFPLVFAENMSYGFRRNLFAIRHVGTVAIIVAGLVNIALIITTFQDGGGMYLSLAALLTTLVFGTLFKTLIKPSWVKEAANAYAHRLLEAIDQLSVRS